MQLLISNLVLFAAPHRRGATATVDLTSVRRIFKFRAPPRSDGRGLITRHRTESNSRARAPVSSRCAKHILDRAIHVYRGAHLIEPPKVLVGRPHRKGYSIILSAPYRCAARSVKPHTVPPIPHENPPRGKIRTVDFTVYSCRHLIVRAPAGADLPFAFRRQTKLASISPLFTRLPRST